MRLREDRDDRRGVWNPGPRVSRAAGIALASVLVIGCSLALLVSHRLGSQITLAGSAALDQDLLQEAQYHGAQEQMALASYRLGRGEPALDAFRLGGRRVDHMLRQMVALDGGPEGAADGTDDSEDLDRLQEIHADYRTSAEQLVVLLNSGRPKDAERLAVEQVEPRGVRFLAALDTLASGHSPVTVAALDEARRNGRVLRVGTPIVLVLTLMMLGGLSWVTRGHQRTVRRQSLYDALTGLPNRILFTDRAGQAVASSSRRAGRPVVLMLDLDRFKEVNDTLGHDAGDALLVQVATRLTAVLRPSDTVARFGGDEFAVLLTDGGPDIGREVADRILRALEPAFNLDGVSVGVEASIGIATTSRNGHPAGADGVTDQVMDLLRHADTAMYVAKAERSGFAHYTAGSADDNTTAHLSLLGELREALDGDQLVLHYQPKVSADTGELRGVEALVRWQHPTRGLVPPDQFIGLAEGTTLIHRLTHSVVSKALKFTREWLDEGARIPVSVNVSARTLLDRGFPARIAAQLDEAGVPAELLGIEITESTIMLDPERALTILRELRDMGIRLSVDDFGTGYSSMAYLKLLPVNELKVDRSFVRDMADDCEDAVLVQSAIELGHNLGLSVVAEGVEDGATLVALQDLGADDVQGYYLGRPMPERALRDWVEERADRFATASARVAAPAP